MARQLRFRRLALAAVAAALAFAGPAVAAPATVVALGDSLTAGFGLPPGTDFPAVLQAALRAKGWDVTVANAGVSGDTASDGAARVDWSVPDGTAGVIVELGANDALRGLDPALTKAALDRLLGRLGARRIPALIAGMKAPRNLGAGYDRAFDAIFPALATAHRAMLYPFFLDGVATDATLNQADLMHPNPAGVKIIVERMLPTVERFLEKVAPAARRPS
ncbi:MAG TPA: arylesterase [Hyphomicrobiales bacterium]|nr:arylesterase [Hyphomicrobiales bacterium]